MRDELYFLERDRVTRKVGDRAHVASREFEYDRVLGRSRSPTNAKARRPTDIYDELGYVSEERRIRMDRLADEWQAYNCLTPPKF